MATDARFTLAQLKHWDTRLAQELEILQHDIESSEATHHTCVRSAQRSRACVRHSWPNVECLSPGTAASAARRPSRCAPCASRRSCVGSRCEVRSPPSPLTSSALPLLPSRRTISRRRCARPQGTSGACGSSSVAQCREESATRDPRTPPPLTPPLLTTTLTTAFQLLIFAPNHAAAARAHGSWRPLPAARQFAPVRALHLPVTLGAVAHRSSGALLPWRRNPR